MLKKALALWQWLKGKKTYLALVGGAIVLTCRFLNIDIPGVAHMDPIDGQTYARAMFELVVTATIRHGMATGA